MTQSTAWFDVYDALVSRVRAATAFQYPGAAGTLIPVYDSVEVGLSNDIPPTLLVIGWTGDPDDSAPADPGQTTQTIATLGTSRHRGESGEINCMAITKQGDALTPTAAGQAGTVSAARQTVRAVLDSVDAVLRADPSLGIVPPYSAVVAYIGGLPSIQTWLNEGVICRAEFTVTYTARI